MSEWERGRERQARWERERGRARVREPRLFPITNGAIRDLRSAAIIFETRIFLSAPGHNEEAGGTVGGRDNGGRYEEINPPRHSHPRLTPSAGHAGNPLDLPFPWRPPCPTNPRRLEPMRVVVVVVASLLSYYESPHPNGRVGKPLSLSLSLPLSPFLLSRCSLQ